MKIKRLIVCLFLFASVVLYGAETEMKIYVSDSYGLNQAHETASAYYGKKTVTIILREGKYRIQSPLLFTAEHSGTKEHPVKITAYPNEHAVITTAEVLQGLKWSKYRNGIMQAQMDKDLVFDQLFVNGEKQHPARFPNYNPHIRHFNGYSEEALAPERVSRWQHPEGGIVHALHRHEWGGYQYLIRGKDAGNQLILEGGFQNNRQMGMHKSYCMVENIFEELDTESEWYYDRKKRILYFYPPKNLDLDKALIEIPQLENIFIFKGNQENPVKHIEISHLTLEHTLRTFMKTQEPLLRSDWTIYRGAAILLEGAENCAIKDCNLSDMGGNAIFFSKYNRNCVVQNNHITKIGASAVSFVGSPNAVRSPVFEYSEFVDWNQMDKQPGAINEDYPANCVVDNNLIHEIGQVEKQVAGVQISMSKNITISHNSIYEAPRAGINISEGTWGGHLIEWNDVFDTVLETGDHGSFNSWGRDRFWLSDRQKMDSLNREHPQLALLDAGETTVIRNNRWRCDHGWDIDLDDGSSNYHIYNNLCLNGGLKLREGFYRVVENNIIVNNSFHPHVWFENSHDVFRHNIVTRSYYPVRIKDWGKDVDFNFFADSVSLKQAQKNGTDNHSLFGNPLFVNPETGDYQVNENSPALKIGFENFAMDVFGVQLPALKKIARVPQFPTLRLPTISENEEVVHEWLGASLKNLSTEGERSATGMDAIRGVLITSIDDNSVLKNAGIMPNDVILKCNSRNTDHSADLEMGLSGLQSGDTVKLVVFSNQRSRTVSFVLP
ncbi:peptide-binding protein [Bacteroidia bacterium]|nr:peptide-binding protein [Bacteroidia bacterium]